MVEMRALACVFVALTVAGCSFFDKNPYADFVVGRVNETAPETPAVVLVGDPQVSSRESLINDRIREVDHLEALIEESKRVSFEPQLKRDLDVIRAFATQLGLSFNPTSGSAVERQEGLAELRTAVEEFKLRNELDRLKKLSQENPSDEDLEPQLQKPEPPAGLEEPSVAEIKNQLNKAVVAAENLLAEVSKSAADGRASETNITVSPEDHFEDLNAYRARLRQRQNQIRLDDAHDAAGRSLYRLQFSAAVLPGAVKDKFAVLDVEISPVRVSADEIRGLYDRWLEELSARSIRLVTSEGSGLRRDHFRWEQVQTELIRARLTERVLLRGVPLRTGGQITIPVFTYPGNDRETIIRILNDKKLATFLDKSASESFSVGRSDGENSCHFLITDQNGVTKPKAYTESKAVVDARASISVMEVVVSAIKADVDPEYATNLLRDIEKVYRDAATVLQNMKAKYSAGKKTKCFEAKATMVPPEFSGKVSKNNHWAGDARTYQAQPTERVQRISSVASAVHSMQMAFSLAALLPNSGIGLNAGAGAAKTAIGMAEAIERTPLVIGYTDHQAVATMEESSSRFGYVFGPRAVLSTEVNGLEYRQQARSHPVFADITVPSWWPAILLKVRSAWAENWHSGTHVLKKGNSRSITVNLRPRSRDAGRLTEFILDNPLVSVSDLDVPTINSIYPEEVSGCTGHIVFLVAGDNLWRSPAAYLRGRAHRSIEILPDMRGLEITFDVDNLPVPPHADAVDDKVTVWTSLGSVSKEVKVVNSRLGAPCQSTSTMTGIGAYLSPASPRVVGGTAENIRVNLARPLPAAARNVKVLYQLSTIRGVAFGSEEIDETSMFPGSYAEGSATIEPPAGTVGEAVNGAPLRVGLSYQTFDGGDRQRNWAGRAMVYYVDDAASRFDVDTDMIDGLPGTVILTPPVQLLAGYPDFVPNRGNFVAEIAGSKDAKLKAIADWNSVPGKVVVSVEVGNIDARKAFLKVACKNETQLVILAADNSEKSPAVVGEIVKIKRQVAPADCGQ